MTSTKLSFSPFGSIGGYPSSYQAFFIRSLFNFFTFTPIVTFLFYFLSKVRSLSW